MAGQDPRYQQKRRRNPRWLPFVLILVGIYVLNNMMPLIIAALALLVGLGLLYLLLPTLLSVLEGTTVSTSHTATMQRGLSWLDGAVRELLVPKSGPPFSSSQPETSYSTPAAEAAMSRAGWSFDHNVWLSDVGILAYRDAKPTLHRSSGIPDDVKYIRPFIVMEITWHILTRDLQEYGGVRFNLIDGEGKLRFTARKRYNLKPGQNFLTPETWLPVSTATDRLSTEQNNLFTGEWQLQVLAGQSVIAEHTFGWRQVTGSVSSLLTADGEVHEQTQEWLDDVSDEPLSLADLMAQQAEDERQNQQTSHAGAR